MLKLKAHAKINLSLKIIGLRPDGYHELESLMQSISLADLITLTEQPSGISLSTNNLRLPIDSRNLAYQAAELFLKNADRGIKIQIEKNIPLASGLAGGSADAAAVLFGLNKLHHNHFSLAELQALGAQIGSDVPFCLVGGSCTVRGRGERVSRNLLNVKRHYVVVIPDVEVPTKWAYEAFDKQGGTPSLIVKNDLEPVVIKKYPVIQKVKQRLAQLGCTFAQMSGSGSSVFGSVSSPAAGQAIVEELRKEYQRSYLTESVDEGIALLTK